MKKTLALLLLISFQTLFAQQPYYNNVDLSLTGQDLYYALQQKIQNASSSFSYNDNKESMKITDEDPDSSNKVLLIYGYNDSDGNCTTDRSRNKNKFGGGNCEYNREHTFARSNADPSMGNANSGSTGIVADPHNVRPSDQKMNNNRGNRKFGTGSGNAGTRANGTWYPGDEWKGDVARIMMYMYTRYGNRCKPTLNGTGSMQAGTDMLQIYLQWNAEDPVSDLEDQRNPHLENVYGNRNPFIDNPYLATLIWGGPIAQDRWNMVGVEEFNMANISVYPNPASEMIWVSNTSASPLETYVLYDISGRVVMHETFDASEKKIDIAALESGIYLLELNAQQQKVVKKIMVK